MAYDFKILKNNNNCSISDLIILHFISLPFLFLFYFSIFESKVPLSPPLSATAPVPSAPLFPFQGPFQERSPKAVVLSP
jgi:hypothetical protein